MPALREDVPLDRHSALLQESTRAYRTVTLFSTGMSLVAVPELDGRIVSVRSSRGEHLSPTDVGEWAYPYAGGIFARIFPDPPREWMLEESNGKLAMMTRNGPMEARLEYELLGNAVHCLCTVRNIGNRPLDARIVWQVARGKHPEVKASPETTLAQNQVLSLAQSYEF